MKKYQHYIDALVEVLIMPPGVQTGHIPVVFSSHITVNSEILARVLFLRNFAYVKFLENNTLAICQNHSFVY